MIYLTEGNTPLNEAYNDEIVHLGNNTYQLTFRFPTSDTKWELLKEETFLTADDLHGEQDFYIFEVEKQQGYIQVYANQVISLLNNYIVSSIEVDRVSGTRVLSAFAGSITRANPFSFFSDIDDRHTLNIKDKNAMEVLAKGKHSILGQWGGDMVRNGYNLRLLKNGGSENESLFMYKKNLSSYQHKTSTKSLKTRITFKTTVKGEGENAVDHDYMVVIDSPLLGNYSQIYEDVVEVNDQDVTDEASLIEYGKQYFRTSMCDMLEDNLEISVVGQSDVAVQMFDVVSFYHEWYGLDVRKKITKYTYSPMAKLLKSIGFGTFQSSLANAIGGIVNDAVLNESRNLHQIFEERLKKKITNADRAFDAEFDKREKAITDAIELAKARAEEVKRELSDTINQRFNSFDNGPLKETKRKAEEALRNAGASILLAQEAKRIGLDSVARLEAFKSQTTSAQTALSGDLDALKQTVTSEVNQASEYRRTTTEVLSRMTGQMDGFATKSEVRQDVAGLTETFAKLKTDTNNLISGAKSEITLAKTEFQKTADGLSAKMSAVERYVNQDGQRQEALQRYTREESARQVSAVREQISRDYVGKSAYQEDVRGLERRFSAISTQTNNDIARKIAQYKQTVDGQFASITSQIAGKANQTDFQRVKETSKLYERILGNSKNGIANTIARMAMTHQLFQVEVSKNDHLKTVQRQLAGSWSVQNINSAGDLISGINLGANGHNRLSGKLTHITGETLIDRAVIKSAMVDKLKTANFEAGSVTTTILDAEAVTADKVRFDAAFIRKMTANDAFIDQLTSKRIFSIKVESVISSSTFLEAYQGRIGGFTLGQFDQGGGRWISGVNQFSVGMGNGAGYGVRTAFWANWGNNWNYTGPKAWNVNTDGKMYCRNEVGFYDQVDFSNSSRANFYGNTTFSRSPVFSNGIELGSKDVFGDGWNPKGGRNAVVWWNQVGSGSVKYWMEQKSDRRLKENITDTAVKALDKINRLRMVAFDFIESKKHEEIGLIAQEAETIVPRIVSRDPENPDGYLHIDYTALVPYLIKAIQELNQKIEKMEKTIA
ncbi:PblB [Streptococcus pneumoniae]|uniref:phage tail spike protein n=1 Tax=Streptococcus pneumoniae TaxID=1313 RepID=UPI0005EA4058|nr:phage tail spike protein [Streptococcus pneumoniae]CIO43839.1 PblB [Streptococcus pneumoniae]